MSVTSSIRPAEQGEAESLSALAWNSKEYWDYTIEEMSAFYPLLEITEEFLEGNPTYVMEDEETGELLGFYSIGKDREGLCWLRHIWVSPEHIGTGLGGRLFLDACEMAETVGAGDLYILAYPNSEPFFLYMGAERLGEKTVESETVEHKLPMLMMKL